MEAKDDRTIHYTELPPYQDGGPLSVEWEFYRREVGRLLAEGNEGRWVFIKGEEIFGIFDTREAAMAAARKRFPFPRPAILVHQIQTRERLLRVSWFWMAGSCRTSL